MSEPQAQGQAARPAGKGGSDRWVKRGFLLVMLAAAVSERSSGKSRLRRDDDRDA